MNPCSQVLYKFRFFIFKVASIACSLASPLAVADDTTHRAEQSIDLLKDQAGRLVLAVSVQWEGESLSQQNLDAIRSFTQKYPSINLIHFLNPAYFTKPNINKDDVKAKIKSVIRPGDSIGLQILGWKSLINAAGLKFRNTPTFWGNKLDASLCAHDCGHEVPISIYNKDELSKLFASSMEIFRDHGLGKPTAFMAGGWMASNHVLEAAMQAGIKYDFSGVAPHVVEGKLKKYPIFRWIAELWNNTTTLSQPTPIPTQAGWIQEYYSNGGTIDYVNEKDIVDLFRGYANLLKQNPTNTYLLHIGFYQETAAKNLSRLENAIQQIFAHSDTNKVPLSMFRIPEIKNIAAQKPVIPDGIGDIQEQKTGRPQ